MSNSSNSILKVESDYPGNVEVLLSDGTELALRDYSGHVDGVGELADGQSYRAEDGTVALRVGGRVVWLASSVATSG